MSRVSPVGKRRKLGELAYRGLCGASWSPGGLSPAPAPCWQVTSDG